VYSPCAPNSTVVGVPAHIVYRNGERVLITDPHDVKDPLSDALIALSARVEELEQCMCVDGAPDPCGRAFCGRRSRAHSYRVELDRLREYVSMVKGSRPQAQRSLFG